MFDAFREQTSSIIVIFATFIEEYQKHTQKRANAFVFIYVVCKITLQITKSYNATPLKHILLLVDVALVFV